MKRVSDAQKRMYFEEMKAKGERVYNINVFYEILGKIDYKKLKESVKSIINEEENLSSKYHLINEEVTKQENEKEIEIIEKDISEAEIRNFIKNYKSVIDIEKGPVVRVSILKVSTIYCILAIEAHHISMDGTSVDILQNKILNRYQGKEELKKVEDQEIEIENDISIKSEEANQYFENENKQGYEALEIREFHEKNIKNSEGFSVE
ncbi:MAG: condensation domain-containing protein, partial [Fusobacteria bacterium]|nr:condensation domain-containing protein [Fusobacteriota bacterium]